MAEVQVTTEIQYIVVQEQPNTTIEIAEQNTNLSVLSAQDNTLELVQNITKVTIDNQVIETTAVIQQQTLDVIEIGIAGPAGATGALGDEELPYSKQTDFVGETHIYKGIAAVGSSTSVAVWQIQKIEFVGADEDVSITWANGSAAFNNTWDSRESLTYT